MSSTRTPTNTITDQDVTIAGRIAELHFACKAEVLPIVGHGSVNKVLAVEAGGQRIIVRMRTREGLNEYHKEAWCLRQAASAGIPSPEVIDVGVVEDTAYMILEFVEGVGGKVYEGDKLALWKTVGRYARIIHSIPVFGFGNELRDGERRLFGNNHTQSWPDFARYNIESLTADDVAITTGVYDVEARPFLVGIFEDLLAQDFSMGVNHGDLALRNTIVGPDGTITLFDWGCASVNVVPYSEFASLLTFYSPNSDVLSAYFDGYGLSRDEVDGMMPTLRRFQMIQTFDTFRWSVDHCIAEVDRYAERAASVLREARGLLE